MPDLDRVVAVAVDLLRLHGEGGLRIEDVQEHTGISKSSLYAHFGDRDGLVAAALTGIYETHVKESVAAIRATVDGARTAAELRESLRGATTTSQDLARAPARMDRIAVIAGTRGRPAHARALTEAQTRLTDELERIIKGGQDRGVVARRHAPRAIANLLQAYTLGRILVAFDASRPRDAQAQWSALIDEISAVLLFDDR